VGADVMRGDARKAAASSLRIEIFGSEIVLSRTRVVFHPPLGRMRTSRCRYSIVGIESGVSSGVLLMVVLSRKGDTQSKARDPRRALQA